jgi:hypothetical protein
MAKRINLGKLPSAERRAIDPRHVLSLSGGGFRGLFTARVLELMEEETRGSLRDHFDVIGGTSIGGILAIGVACGVPAAKMREQIAKHGPSIFRSRWSSAGGFLGAKYDPAPLREAIKAILGPVAEHPFAALPKAALVVAVNEKTSSPKIFVSDKLALDQSERISTIDVALATSAAPTYFPPHKVDGEVYVDGGIVANAPDLILASATLRKFGINIENLHVCAIGTAGSPRVGAVQGSPGKLGWVVRHDVITLTLDAQAALAARELDGLVPGRVLRLNAIPSKPIELDDVSPSTAKELLNLADKTFELAKAQHAPKLRQFLAHKSLLT